MVPDFLSRKILKPVGWWLEDYIGMVFAVEAGFSLYRMLCDLASGTLMKIMGWLKFP